MKAFVVCRSQLHLAFHCCTERWVVTNVHCGNIDRPIPIHSLCCELWYTDRGGHLGGWTSEPVFVSDWVVPAEFAPYIRVHQNRSRNRPHKDRMAHWCSSCPFAAERWLCEYEVDELWWVIDGGTEAREEMIEWKARKRGCQATSHHWLGLKGLHWRKLFVFEFQYDYLTHIQDCNYKKRHHSRVNHKYRFVSPAVRSVSKHFPIR